MRFDLTLAKKGLILVSIPLLFELAFVAILACLLHQAESEIARERHARAIIETTNRLIRDLYEASVELHRAGEDKDYEEQIYSDTLGKLRAKVLDLKLLVKDTPGERPVIERAEKAADRGMQLLSESRSAALGMPDRLRWAAFERAKTELKPLVTGLAQDLLALVEEEKGIEAQMPALQAKSRQQIEILLAAGVAFNVLLALSLALYFNRGTAARLQVLMDNTRRLTAAQPLNPPLSGNDEVAHLDRVFNDMAAALAQARRKERAIIENAIDVICSLDAQGRFAAVSPASGELFGYSPDELIGKDLLQIVVDADVALTKQAAAELRRAQKASSFENRVRRKDGTMVDVLWSGQWSEIEQATFCVAHNITARKEMERLKQEFVAMVSHDLRTPLTSIGAALELISTGCYGQLSERGEEILETAESNIQRLIALINDLLDVEKMESGKLEMLFSQTDMALVFERCLQALLGFAQQHGVALKVEPGAPEAFADADRLVQVLVNLVSNAVKFSPSGSAVTLSARTRDDLVEVRVADKGRGIPEKFQAAIFDRFQQVETADATKKGGSGLGLAICKAIVEGHGGTIGVESKEGSGSTFWFTIKAYPGNQGRQQVDPAPRATAD